ncbi:MAG TPA: uroporphyrinogen decarboxylase family protein, partial [Arenicellales bacterium]|nr:uroporphyrinogen decarboxylase family protein [Arenicellales bacterium]
QYVCVTCDVGTQNNIMISKEHFDTFIRPYESMIFDAIRDGGAKVALHSCGSVFEIVPQIIDCGVDILNPIQTSASGMDTRKLKQEFGRDLCFWGGIDVQQVLRSGTVDEVRQETRRVIEDLSPGGGYLFAPSHDIQTGTPLDNVMAMFETAREIGGRH